MDSPFDVLGICSDADDAEIDRAYRQRVKESHPDHDGSAREFQRVREAYEALQSGNDIDPVTEHNSKTETETETETENEQQQQDNSRIKYLNYEVFSDYGWDIGDENLFEKANAKDLDPTDYGEFLVQPHESLLEAAEARGFAWPFACRGGACANCAVLVVEGELDMPVNHILPTKMIERGIRLSCNGMPATDEMKIVYNIKHMPGLDELRLPPRPFEQAHLDD